MPRAKFDGVIEAVRYAKNGEIALVRAYERRGLIWSDQILLGRQDLVERLKQGLRFVTGLRKPFLGGVFEIKKTVHYTERGKSGFIVATDGATTASEQHPEGRDALPGIPIF